MKNRTISVISIIIVFFAALFLFEPKTQANLKIDDNYLIARAISLANFSSNEIPTIPRISYLMPGEREVLQNKLDHSTKVVNVFDPRFGVGGIQAVFKAPEYKVQDGGQTVAFSSFKKTVGDILEENGIILAKEDQVTPSVNELPSQNIIKITRVSVAEIDEFETLPYQTKNINDPTLDQGKTKVQTPGQNGKKKLTYQVRRENGVEASRILLTTTIVTGPTDKVVKVGTKPVITGWCKYNSDVLDASVKNSLDPNKLCALMKKESNGNSSSVNPDGPYIGLFQYSEGFWADASSKAGYAGASIYDARSQIFVTAWALTHGYSGRW